MDFTREPIIETVITPKEGYKLVVRSSKAIGQEEYFVDAVEVVSFGQALFFRSIEKPKAFLVPTSDYEILEVREARMVLKHVGLDRAIKIGGGKEPAVQQRTTRESAREQKESLREVREREQREQRELTEKPEAIQAITPAVSEAALATPVDAPISEEARQDGRFDRKRDRRRHYRRRRGRDDSTREGWNPETGEQEEGVESEEKIQIMPPRGEGENETQDMNTMSSSILSSLLPPPPTLISETIARYRENDMFKDVFFLKASAMVEEREHQEEMAAHAQEEMATHAQEGQQPGEEGIQTENVLPSDSKHTPEPELVHTSEHAHSMPEEPEETSLAQSQSDFETPSADIVHGHSEIAHEEADFPHESVVHSHTNHDDSERTENLMEDQDTSDKN